MNGLDQFIVFMATPVPAFIPIAILVIGILMLIRHR